MNTSLIRGLAVTTVGLLLWLSPAPLGLKPQVWQLFAIFAATIVGFILQPLPISGIAIISLAVAGMTGVLKPAELLSGFSSTTVWLIVAAFLYAAGFVKTGLGRRMAFIFMRLLGDSTLKLGYALVLSNLLMAPATPSNTARAGGFFSPSC